MTDTNNSKVVKLLTWIVEDKLWTNYKLDLQHKSDSTHTYWVNDEGWKEYKKQNHPLANRTEEM